MKTFEDLPEQMRADVGECVDAFYHGGRHLAELVFRSVCGARNLTAGGAAALGGYIRARLAELGFLPIRS